MKRDRTRLVYSTGPRGPSTSPAGSCPRCRRDPCSCAVAEEQAPASQKVGVRRERAGRRGKTVTVAGPLVLPPSAARALLKALKQECGSGGTLREHRDAEGRVVWFLEIQGDHVERLLDRLGGLGYRPRRQGG